MSGHFETIRQTILDRCTACGACADICPGVDIAGLDALDPAELQEALLEFIRAPRPSDTVSMRIDACLECFRCADACPEDLEPLSLIETAKALSFREGFAPYIHASPEDVSRERAVIDKTLSQGERDRVCRASGERRAGVLFFPGCNVYNAPQRVVRARAVLERIAGEHAFLPGLEFCCGDRFLFDGRADEAEAHYTAFCNAMEALEPETIVLWCPTCLTRMRMTWKSSANLVSFFQFCRDHLDRLRFSPHTAEQAVTLHEPCKTAYTGLDDSHRDVIRAIPNLHLREMPSGVTCCGSGGLSHYRERTLEEITRTRLREARETGADRLITICHFCQEVLERENPGPGMEVVNLLDVLFERLEGSGNGG